MIRELAKSIREYKKVSIMTPILVSMEVVMECLIPFIIANLVNQIKAGCEFQVIAVYGLVLVLMAGISLLFGAWAGNTCSTASCGLAKNLRKDMFYNIQNFSFENIDKFSASSLVTRLTTDVTNVQMAYMMIIRIAIRCPLMLIFAFIMAFVMGGKMAAIFLFVVPVLGFGWLPALIALALYGILPVLQGTLAGLGSIPPGVSGVAEGMGMTGWQRLYKVELPLAAPVILAGIRTSVIVNIGTATIASTVGASTLGTPIIIGLSGFNTAYIVQGALLVALAAIIVDRAFERLTRWISRHRHAQ